MLIKHHRKYCILFLFFGISLFAQGKLDTLVSFEFSKVPLHKVLNTISKEFDIQFVFASESMQAVIANYTCKNKPLQAAIKEILKKCFYKITFQKGNLIAISKIKRKEFSITGYVFDSKTKEPLPYANIFIDNDFIGATSGKNGKFILTKIKAGKIKLHIKYIGFVEKEISLTLNSDVDLDIPMARTFYTLGKIEIIDKKNQFVEKNILENVTSISPLAYRNLPILGQPDIIRSLQLLPGIASNAGGATELSIYSSTSSENLVSVDDIQLYHLSHFFGFYSSLSAGSVKDIRLFKGNFPAKYGGKTSSVLEMTCKNGDLNKSSLAVELNSLSGELNVNLPISNRISMFFAVRRILFPKSLYPIYEKLMDEKIAGDYYIPKHEYFSEPYVYFADAFFKLNYVISDSDMLSTSFLITEDNHKILFNNIWSYFLPDSTKEYFNATLNKEWNFWSNRGGNITWYRQWNKKLKSKIFYSLSEYKSKYLYTENWAQGDKKLYEFTQENRILNSSLNSEINLTLNNYFDIQFGFSHTRNDIEYSKHLFIDKIFDKNIILDNNGYLNVFYLQNKFKYKRFYLQTGIRSTFNSILSKNFIVPRINATYFFMKEFSLSTSFGRYNQFIIKNIDSDTHLNGNINWIAADDSTTFVSNSTNFSLSANYKTKEYDFNLTLFFSKKNNVFPFYTARGVFVNPMTVRNKSKAKVHGLEFQILKKLGNLTGWISYTYSNSEIFESQLFDSAFPTSNSIPHNFKTVLRYKLWGVNSSLAFTFASGTPFTIPKRKALDGGGFYLTFPKNINEERLDNLIRFDFSISKEVETRMFKFEAGVSIYNLFNRKNYYSKYYYLKKSKLQSTANIDFPFTVTLFAKVVFH